MSLKTYTIEWINVRNGTERKSKGMGENALDAMVQFNSVTPEHIVATGAEPCKTEEVMS